jgi:hypothetical protein
LSTFFSCLHRSLPPPNPPAAAAAAAAAAVAAEVDDIETSNSEVLKHIVAWLVINSMRSEQTQWSMLCIQNIGNIYRKTVRTENLVGHISCAIFCFLLKLCCSFHFLLYKLTPHGFCLNSGL